MDDIESLKKLKEELKNQVVSLELDWFERMKIYSEIQKINAEIEKNMKV